MAKVEQPLEKLQTQWKEMYQDLLPEAARSQSPTQPKWPVTLDHCFARIILDHTVGINTPWTSKIKSPAYKNMSAEQLEASICLGRKILKGKADLVDLDNRSLILRGKIQKTGAKRGREGAEDVEQDVASAKVSDMKRARRGDIKVDSNTAVAIEEREERNPPSSPEDNNSNERSRYFTAPRTQPRQKPTTPKSTQEDLTPYLKKIALSNKTPFQKRVLSSLCQIPRGKYTTYGALSKHLSSSPRAVGNAVRNNPFPPHVPCHRVVASGGGIGGFQGSWGRKGEKGLNDDKKRGLLREEGVRFDGSGKVVGSVWEGFK